MLGIKQGLEDVYDQLTEDQEEVYGVPVFYEEENLYEYLREK
jgi:hypothetical protein